MRYLHVLNAFLSASLQEEMAYRSNFVISLFNSLLGLISSTILYSLLLLFSSLAFWSNGFLVNWIFDGLFQLARSDGFLSSVAAPDPDMGTTHRLDDDAAGRDTDRNW